MGARLVDRVNSTKLGAGSKSQPAGRQGAGLNFSDVGTIEEHAKY